MSTAFLTGVIPATPPTVAPPASPPPSEVFFPQEVDSLDACGIKEGDLETLVLKFLFFSGPASGREIAHQIALPFRLLCELLLRMKVTRLVVYKGEASVQDFVYELTEKGTEQARRAAQASTYFGTAPVAFASYIESIHRQTISACRPALADLARAFHDLVLDQELLFQVGEAVHAGRGVILYGPPGNGKTSIAERISRVFGEGIWIPRAINAWGEIIRLYDPSSHEALEPPAASEPFDRRWIYVRRPTIVAGGELTLDALDVTNNPATGVSEAPLQLKSNGGALVIDDFGRQRVSVRDLLNRWVVPLEKRCDYINLVSGRKVQVPFDQLLIFSTNLEPRDLVDEAFLRRIAYKVRTPDPTEEQFRALFLRTAQELELECNENLAAYLLQKHYGPAERPLRFCHARDLLGHVKHYCAIRELPPVVTEAGLDAAVQSYFA